MILSVLKLPAPGASAKMLPERFAHLFLTFPQGCPLQFQVLKGQSPKAGCVSCWFWVTARAGFEHDINNTFKKQKTCAGEMTQ